jgi:opacity protein-like surface antigen
MKRITQSMTFFVFLLVPLTGAWAAGNFYLGLHGGAAILDESKATDNEGRYKIDYDIDFDGSVTLGYKLGDKFPKIGRGRVELEVNYAENDLDEADFTDGKVSAGGSIKRTGIMFNSIGEHRTDAGVIIHALLGIGWAKIDLDNATVLDQLVVDDDDSQLAFQIGAGVGYQLNSRITYEVGYRYFFTLDPSYTTDGGKTLDYEYGAHRILAGIRFNF